MSVQIHNRPPRGALLPQMFHRGSSVSFFLGPPKRIWPVGSIFGEVWDIQNDLGGIGLDEYLISTDLSLPRYLSPRG